MQETLLAVHNQRHTYDAGQPLTAWVHAIARYKLVDLLRRRARATRSNDPLDDERRVARRGRQPRPRTRDATWRSCSTPCPTGSACRSST